MNYVQGRRPYQTICRLDNLREDIPFLRSAFRNEMGPGGLLTAVFAGENAHARLEGPVLGLDECLPHQILQLAHEECVAKGWLQGPAHFVQMRDASLFTAAPVPTKAILQPEAGNKVRALSEPPAFVTVFLQPFAHWLAGLANHVPSLRSAFSRSYKGWDLAVSLSRRTDNYIEPQSGFSVIDLVGSTNGIDWDFALALINPLIARFTTNVYEQAYFTEALKLLLIPRCMEFRRDPKDIKHQVCLTSCGVHMGDPGAKEILCIMNAAIELMVYSDVEKPVPTLIAGDDIGAPRTECRHYAIIAKHRKYGNEVNKKAQFSKVFVVFCEEILRYRPQSFNTGVPPWKMKDNFIHLDVVKMRLISPFSSTGDFDIKTNPAFGKGSALYDQLLNIKGKEKSRYEYILWTFNNWMSSFLRDDPWVYLPRAVGGCNVPWPGNWSELYDRISQKCPGFSMKLFSVLSTQQEEPPMLLHVLARKMSSGGSARGIIDPMNFNGIVQTAYIAGSQFQDQSKTLDWFLEDIQSKRSYECSYKDALRHARQSGYMSTATIAENLDRISTMRLLFAYASGAMGDIDQFLETNRVRSPTPSEIMVQFKAEVEESRELFGIAKKDLKTTPEDVKSFREWVLQGAPNFPATMTKSWVPKEALVDSMNGMTIKMPFAPTRIIPGSENDPDIDIQDVPAALVISRKRRRLA